MPATTASSAGAARGFNRAMAHATSSAVGSEEKFLSNTAARVYDRHRSAASDSRSAAPGGPTNRRARACSRSASQRALSLSSSKAASRAAAAAAWRRRPRQRGVARGAGHVDRQHHVARKKGRFARPRASPRCPAPKASGTRPRRRRITRDRATRPQTQHVASNCSATFGSRWSLWHARPLQGHRRRNSREMRRPRHLASSWKTWRSTQDRCAGYADLRGPVRRAPANVDCTHARAMPCGVAGPPPPEERAPSANDAHERARAPTCRESARNAPGPIARATRQQPPSRPKRLRSDDGPHAAPTPTPALDTRVPLRSSPKRNRSFLPRRRAMACAPVHASNAERWSPGRFRRGCTMSARPPAWRICTMPHDRGWARWPPRVTHVAPPAVTMPTSAHRSRGHGPSSPSRRAWVRLGLWYGIQSSHPLCPRHSSKPPHLNGLDNVCSAPEIPKLGSPRERRRDNLLEHAGVIVQLRIRRSQLATSWPLRPRL